MTINKDVAIGCTFPAFGKSLAGGASAQTRSAIASLLASSSVPSPSKGRLAMPERPLRSQNRLEPFFRVRVRRDRRREFMAHVIAELGA